MLSQLALPLTYAAYLYFSGKRLMTYLHAFQQDDYDQSRFLNWVVENRVFDRRLSFALLAAFCIGLALPPAAALALAFICFAVVGVIEKDPRTRAKKKLVMTKRAQRIFFIALLLAALMGLWWFVLPLPWLWIVNVQILPMLLLVANVTLQPFENYTQAKFWNEAHEKLLRIKPKVIGITGSFGKTSVKHILGHILKMQALTLITPGSTNTPMGITRIIRERLEENCKHFVVEMGAYGPGSIATLCRLAPPDMAIVTAIGHAHYERFKTLDTVAEAKFELAHAALAKDGKVIVAEQVLDFAYTKKIRAQNAAHFIVCGPDAANPLCVRSVSQTPEGLEVSITWRGEAYVLKLPLFGAHHGYNAALAFAAAAELGVLPEHIITALKSTPQIEHRLEVKPQPGGWTIIDDAFNSNPQGFRAALDVLNMRGAAGRKILITPGMAEMGAAHDEEHRKIGAYAGEICDVVLAVVPDRISTFIQGFKETGAEKTLLEVRSFAEASAWLDKNRRAGDVVLLENDLPDIYERLPNI